MSNSQGCKVGKQCQGDHGSGAGSRLFSCAPNPQQHNHYQGADHLNHNELWNRPNVSVDEALRNDRSQLTARSSDAYRNNPLISGALLQERAAQTGVVFRLDWQPFHSLFSWGGDEERELEIEEAIEDAFDMEMESSACWIDAGGRLTLSQLAGQSVFVNILNGEALGVFQWSNKPSYRPHPIKLLMKDPWCVRTPTGLSRETIEKTRLYHGIATSKSGAQRVYYVHDTPPDDNQHRYWSSSLQQKKDYTVIPERWRRDDADVDNHPLGAWLVAHVGDFARMPGATRPEPPMMSMLTQLRASGKWKAAHLDAAWLSSMFATVIESDQPNQMADNFGAGQVHAGMGTSKHDPLAQYMGNRNDYHEGLRAEVFGNTTMLGMYPGEKVNHINAGHPVSGYEAYNRSLLQEIARGFGQSYPEFSGDFSGFNFSAAQMAEINTWRLRLPKVRAVPGALCSKVFYNWMQHKIVSGQFGFFKAGRTPRARLNWFLNHQDKITRCEFHGPKREPNDMGKLITAFRKGHDAGVWDQESYIKDYSNIRYREMVKRIRREKRQNAKLNQELEQLATGGANVAAA